MVDASPNRLVLHTATLCVWLIAAASAAYWVLQINAMRPAANLPVTTAFKPDAIDSASIARLLGATTAPTASPVIASNRFALKGVVSGALGREAALIAIDNKPAQTFKVGSLVEEGLLVQSASPRKVTLAASRDGPALITLEMPLMDK